MVQLNDQKGTGDRKNFDRFDSLPCGNPCVNLSAGLKPALTGG